MEEVSWGFGFTELLIIIVFTLMLSAWVAAISSIIKSEFPGHNDKLIWALLVIFLPFIGTILYFTIGRNKRIKHNY